ncbi:amidase [Pimelobacter simplex]|uniref:amidase n=1 Tax=Nocardioides simplex TaxID=2045 RepID=UPI00214FBDFB|nr:amidase family protein [Pimelobacter simplex]UUW90113.1 amidase family protein [Pimelobacter simplex]UUW93942.1 amidase family protein [Pimelobacter simplex]
MTALHELTAEAAAAEIRARRLSPVELVDAVLDRIERLDPALSCFVSVDAEAARAAARAAEAAVVAGDELGALHGVPCSVKDLIDVQGLPTSRGALPFAGRVAQADAPAATLVRRAGAICVGKTTTPEFGWSFVTSSPVSGSTVNPWCPTRTAGGSSGGAGAALAAGLGPLAVATDGGGSIRLPAAFTGVVGLKPTSGRVPTYPPSDLGTLGHLGPMARSVRDVARLLDVLTGHTGSEPGPALRACGRPVEHLRIGYAPTINGAPVDPEVREVVETWVADLVGAGVAVTAFDLVVDGVEDTWDRLYAQSIARQVDALAPADRALLSPELRSFVDSTRGLPRSAGPDAELARRAVVAQGDALLREYDLVITPTTSTVAFDAGLAHPGTVAGQPVGLTDWTRLTQVWNLTGFPAISLPAGTASDGLPVGVQVAGPPQGDGVLLALAAFAERALGPRLPARVAG